MPCEKTTNPAQISVLSNTSLNIMCIANAEFFQQVILSFNQDMSNPIGTFSGTGEHKKMFLADKSDVLNIDTGDNNALFAQFNFSANGPGGPFKPAVVCAPIVEGTPPAIVITNVTSEDFADNDNNDSYLTIIDTSQNASRMTALDRLKAALVAYYPLKSDAKDYGPNGHNGTANEQVTFSPGYWGNAADFTKSRANIKLPDMGRYADSYALSLWVNVVDFKNIDPEPSSWGNIVGRLSVNHDNGHLLFKFFYDAEDAKDKVLTLTSTGRLVFGEWHHVAVTYNHRSRTFAFFIDGRLDSEYDLSQQIHPTDRPHLPTVGSIGGSSAPTPDQPLTLNGLVGDLFVFKASINQEQVNILSDSIPMSDEVPSDRKRFIFILVGLAAVVGAIVGTTTATSMVNQTGVTASATVVRPRKTLEQIVAEIIGRVRYPATEDKREFVDRQMLELDESYRINLDLGGEGAHEVGDVKSGFNDTINLNTVEMDTQIPGRRIPNLVYLKGGPRWLPPPSYPFKDKFADYIAMQNADLTDKNVWEITRLIRDGGTVELWVDEKYEPQIKQLADNLKAVICRNSKDQFNGKAGNKKVQMIQGSKLHTEL